MPSVTDSYQSVEIISRAAWRRWLIKHHVTSPGIWLVSYKKSAGEKYLAYRDIVEEALCFGWIDSVHRTVDDERSRLLLTPRRAGSGWSGLNKERIVRLVGAGLMTEAGLVKIEEAQKNGSWNKLQASDAMTEPADLKKAFSANKPARKNWNAFPAGARKAALEWIYSAKRPETRTARVEETVALSALNIRPRQWPKPGVPKA